MMRKRILALLACGALTAGAAMGLTACNNNGGGGAKTMLVWGPSVQQEVLREMCAAFLEENPDFGYQFEFGVVGEGDAKGTLEKDPTTGAAVYAYANDQLIDLYNMGALAELPQTAVAKIKEENTEASVESGRIGDKYYGYPYQADNGFFMYYDKSFITEKMTLNEVLDACANHKDSEGRKDPKYLIYQVGTGWYVGSFMYGAGGSYEVTWENAAAKEITINFNDKAVRADGSVSPDHTIAEIGGQALYDLANHKACVNGDDKVITTYIGNRKLGAVITGTWNAPAIRDFLGEHYAATRLPDYKSSLDGEVYKWKSFAGYKLYGVNPNFEDVNKAQQLAAFLSSEAMQEKRYDAVEVGPSNKNVAALDKVKNNVALAAINKQFDGYSVTQNPMPGNYWTAMESFGTNVVEWVDEGDFTYEKLQKRLVTLISDLTSIVT